MPSGQKIHEMDSSHIAAKPIYAGHCSWLFRHGPLRQTPLLYQMLLAHYVSFLRLTALFITFVFIPYCPQSTESGLSRSRVPSGQPHHLRLDFMCKFAFTTSITLS